jgi:serine/threonine-protein kinase
MAETAPQTILAGRYVLEGEIGRGGMASVWRAHDDVLDRPVAVKILHAHLADDPSFLERFQSEALSSAQLAHPNIVNVYDTGTEDGTSFIVMELFEGRTLADVIAQNGPLEPDRAINTLIPVLAALQHAHQNGVIHRDVKPGNILVGDSGMVKITDVGIARAAYASHDATTTGRVLGSVPYLSPEQVQGSDVNPRSDIYACGVVLYEALTGKRPFQAETDLAAATMRLTREPLPARALRSGIPRALDAAVARAMSRRPEDRFQTAENMAAALTRVRGGGSPMQSGPFPAPVTAPVETPPGNRRRSGAFRSWMLVPFLAILLAAVAITVGLLLGKLQIGGPLGIERAPESSPTVEPGSAGAALAIDAVSAFDPFGDDSEHDELAPDAVDNDPGTFWYSENYHQLDLSWKSGIGLLFDLGSDREVTGFQLRTPYPGYAFQIRVGDDPSELAGSEGPWPSFTAAGSMRQTIEPVTGRYVLVWITTVVTGVENGNRASVGEFRVIGSGGA